MLYLILLVAFTVASFNDQVSAMDENSFMKYVWAQPVNMSDVNGEVGQNQEDVFTAIVAEDSDSEENQIPSSAYLNKIRENLTHRPNSAQKDLSHNTTTAATIVVHEQQKLVTKQREYNCFECDKVFKTAWGLSKHSYNIHGIAKKYYCTVCFKGFNSRVTMINHRDSKHRSKLFQCSECQKCFTRVNNLTRHRNNGCGEKKKK